LFLLFLLFLGIVFIAPAVIKIALVSLAQTLCMAIVAIMAVGGVLLIFCTIATASRWQRCGCWLFVLNLHVEKGIPLLGIFLWSSFGSR